MVGILIVTHGNFGTELLKSAELIIGKQENVETLGLNPSDDIKELYIAVRSSIKKLDKGDGVLILTDLFGGSPTNVTAASISDYKCESVSGVNLPMLIETLDSREFMPLEELTAKTIQSGVEGIKNVKNELGNKANSI